MWEASWHPPCVNMAAIPAPPAAPQNKSSYQGLCDDTTELDQLCPAPSWCLPRRIDSPRSWLFLLGWKPPDTPLYLRRRTFHRSHARTRGPRGSADGTLMKGGAGWSQRWREQHYAPPYKPSSVWGAACCRGPRGPGTKPGHSCVLNTLRRPAAPLRLRWMKPKGHGKVAVDGRCAERNRSVLCTRANSRRF